MLCGCGEGVTDGGDDTGVTGTWSYVAEYPGAGDGGCTATTTLELDETEQGLFGRAGTLSIACDGGDAATGLDATLSNVEMQGNTITFTYMTFSHTGTLSGDRISGDAVGGSFEFEASPGSVRTIDGDGTWTATR